MVVETAEIVQELLVEQNLLLRKWQCIVFNVRVICTWNTWRKIASTPRDSKEISKISLLIISILEIRIRDRVSLAVFNQVRPECNWLEWFQQGRQVPNENGPEASYNSYTNRN